jgi:hypothetical protein
VGYRILNPESGRSNLGYKVFGRAYVDGNIMEGYEKITNNNWAGGVQVEDENDKDLQDAGKYTDYIRVDKPLPMAPFRIIPAQEAYVYVLKNAGATLPHRDAMDIRITEQVRTGNISYAAGIDAEGFYQFEHRRLPKDSYKLGIITDISQVGGYPEYRGKPYKDTDKDGMPDDWEVKYKLNPKDPADATQDCNGDGYTNIEKYIHGIDPAKKIDWRDPANNADTLKK